MLSKIISYVSLFSGAVFLSPLVADSIVTVRWPIIVLAVLSAALIVANAANKCFAEHSRLFWSLPLLGFSIGLLGLGWSVDKLSYLGGVLLVTAPLFRKQFRPIAQTCLLLCFASIIPLPAAFEVALSNQLASLEAEMFVGLGQLMGFAVYQVGAQVVLDGFAVAINSDCSGTLLLLPTFLGALVVAGQSNKTLPINALIILSALPIAILVNLIRLAVLVFIGLFKPDALTPELHDMLGWLVMTIAWLMPAASFKVSIYDGNWNNRAALSLLAQSSLFLGLTASAYWGLTSLTQKAESAELQAFPYYVDGWIGETIAIPLEESKILQADKLTRRKYSNFDGSRELLVTLIYHKDPKLAAAHNSEACFQAMGWKTKPLATNILSSSDKVRHLLARDHSRQQAVTEIIMDHKNDTGIQGVTRIQIVEVSGVPFEDRKQTATRFLKAAKIDRRLIS